MRIAQQEEISKDNYRFGMICATIANSNRARKGRTFKPDDFFPTGLKRKAFKAMTGEQFGKLLEQAKLGGRKRHKENPCP